MSTIYVFYNNDPLAQDQGGGAEHFRGLYRALCASGLRFHLVAARKQVGRDDARVEYVSTGSNFLLFWLGLWRWFLRHRGKLTPSDVLHFHRNYAAWPKLLLAARGGRVVVSYHNVTGRVLAGKLGRAAAPFRALMLHLERRVVERADAIVCVSDRDRRALQEIVTPAPFARAHVIPAAFDAALFNRIPSEPPDAELACRLLVMGRVSHQKNLPLAIDVLERLAAVEPEISLTIAGDGEDARGLARRIAGSPSRARISWLGRVPHDHVPALLAAHGVLLVTSRYEASPTVVKEALRAARPVVTTDVGDVGQWIEEDRTGFIRAANAEALADGVLAAIDLLRQGRYVSMREPGHLDEGVIMGRVLHLYRGLMAG